MNERDFSVPVLDFNFDFRFQDAYFYAGYKISYRL